MHFETVYDISVAGCRDWFLAPAALVLLLIGATFPVNRDLAEVTGKRPLSRAGAVAFFGAITLLAFATTWVSYWTLRHDLKDGDVSEVQGLITNLQPAATYKGIERFSAGGRTFSYGRFQVSQGFHTISPDGSPIANGRCVRVVYVGDRILRLSLAQSRGTSDPAADHIPPSLSQTMCRDIG